MTEPETQAATLPPIVSAPKVVRADAISDVTITKRATGDRALDALLLGGFALQSWVGLWGAEGSGKSRCALRWTTNIGNTLWCSLEMPARLVVHTARSCGAHTRRLFIAEDVGPQHISELAAEHRCNVVGFDSISELEPDAQIALMRELTTWVSKGPRLAVCICHATKDGRYRGPSTFGHKPDYVLQASAATNGECTVDVRKTRFGQRGSALCPVVVT